MPLLSLRPGAATAAAILRELFGHIREPFAFRLWDGSEVEIGSGPPAFAVVFKSPEVFGQLMRDPSPGSFAEAFVSSAIDIEGDLFSAMTVANAVEEIDISTARKLRLLWAMSRGRR
jgi:hypothetical protein